MTFIHISSKNPPQDARTALTDLLHRETKRNDILLLLSGGSALQVLPTSVAPIVARRITVSMLDERVSRDSDCNNFLQFSKTSFYEILKKSGARFIETVPDLTETPAMVKKRIERSWREWNESHPGGTIVALMGIGADGHTAGIFTEFEEEMKDVDWTHGFSRPEFGKSMHGRVSATPGFLKQCVTEAIIIAYGREKREVLRRITNHTDNALDLPARVIREMRQATLFTDLP